MIGDSIVLVLFCWSIYVIIGHPIYYYFYITHFILVVICDVIIMFIHLNNRSIAYAFKNVTHIIKISFMLYNIIYIYDNTTNYMIIIFHMLYSIKHFYD